MALGIVSANDQFAIWHEAASEPPSGVQIPNSNKFKIPANSLKNTLDTLAAHPQLNSGQELQEWLTKPTNAAFAKTYFKPGYQPALKHVLGDPLYTHLIKHLPDQHLTALTTHAQKPAPHSNKYNGPVGQLKALLDTNPSSAQIKQWVDGHPAFHTYLGPEYEQALKGDLGQDNHAKFKMFGPGGSTTPEKAPPAPAPEAGPHADPESSQTYVDKLKDSLQKNLPGYKPLTVDQVLTTPGGPHDWTQGKGFPEDKPVEQPTAPTAEPQTAPATGNSPHYDKLQSASKFNGKETQDIISSPGFHEWFHSHTKAQQAYLATTPNSTAAKFNKWLAKHPQQAPAPEQADDQAEAGKIQDLIPKIQMATPPEPAAPNQDQDEISQIQKQIDGDPWHPAPDAAKAQQDVVQEALDEQKHQTAPPPGVDKSNSQHPALAQAVLKVFPKFGTFDGKDIKSMSDDEIKTQLEEFLHHLPNHKGYDAHVPQLQKIYDQWFGTGKLAPPAAEPQSPFQAWDPSTKDDPGFQNWFHQSTWEDEDKALAEYNKINPQGKASWAPGGQHNTKAAPADDLNKLSFGDMAASVFPDAFGSPGGGKAQKFDAMSPEQQKGYLQGWIKSEQGKADGGLEKLKAYFDAHYGDGAPSPEQGDLVPNKHYDDLLDIAESDPNVGGSDMKMFKSPEFQQWFLKQWSLKQKSLAADPMSAVGYFKSDTTGGDDDAWNTLSDDNEPTDGYYQQLVDADSEQNNGNFGSVFKSPAFKDWWSKQDEEAKSYYGGTDPSEALKTYDMDTGGPTPQGEGEPGSEPSDDGTLLGDLKKAWPEMATMWDKGKWSGSLTTAEQSEMLQNIIKHNKGQPEEAALQAVYDKYFGATAGKPEVTSDNIAKDLVALGKGSWSSDSVGIKEDLKKAKTPEQLQAVLKGWAKSVMGNDAVNAAQQVYDKYFGDGATKSDDDMASVDDGVESTGDYSKLNPDDMSYIPDQDDLDKLKDEGKISEGVYKVLIKKPAGWWADKFKNQTNQSGFWKSLYEINPMKDKTPAGGAGNSFADVKGVKGGDAGFFSKVPAGVTDTDDEGNYHLVPGFGAFLESKGLTPESYQQLEYTHGTNNLDDDNVVGLYNQWIGKTQDWQQKWIDKEKSGSTPTKPDTSELYGDLENAMPDVFSEIFWTTKSEAMKQQSLKDYISNNPEDADTLQPIYDKYFGAGAASTPSPSGPLNTDQVFKDYTKATNTYDPSDWMDTSFYNEHQHDTPSEIYQALKEKADKFAGSHKGNVLQGILDEHFPNGDPGASPYDTGQAAVPPAWDSSKFAEDFKVILPNSGSSVAQGSATLDKAKVKVEQLINDNPGTPETEKLQKLHDKWFGAGLPSQTGYTPKPLAYPGATFHEEPEEDEGVSAPFKANDPTPEDLKKFQTKPVDASDWKQFASWWGQTKLTPEQELGIYKTWFPTKNVTADKASSWFQKVYDFHSKPSSGDLGVDTVPSWAHNSWAFGSAATAAKEWPTFKVWAANAPGLPQDTSIKQKLQIWNSLTAGDKKIIAENYTPKKAVDANAVVSALQKAYPKSDFSAWSKMPQGTLKNNVEILAKAGYKGGVAAFNQFYGGKMEEPTEDEKPPEGLPEPPPIPMDKVPKWFGGYGGVTPANAKVFSGLAHFAKLVGTTDEQLEKGGNEIYQVRQAWNQMPEYLKRQIGAMATSPWKNVDDFQNWYGSQPTPYDDLMKIDPNGGWSTYTYKKQPVSYGGQGMGQILGNKIDGTTDPEMKKKLLEVYHKYWGNSPTLGQAMSAAYPVPPKELKAKSWDEYLQNHSTSEVQTAVKKLLKSEKDPDKWIQVVDAWAKYIGGLSGVGAISKTIGKNVTAGGAPHSQYLSNLYAWKKSALAPSAPVPYVTDTDSPYVKNLILQGHSSGYFTPFHGWTPPVITSQGKADPAMLGSNHEPNYTAPEASKGKFYTALLENADQHGKAYGTEDKKLLNSDEFQSWFESQPTNYKKVFQSNPGIAMDDYKAFMSGDTATGEVPEGDGAKTYDLTPFHNAPRAIGPNKVQMGPNAPTYKVPTHKGQPPYPGWSKNPVPGMGRPHVDWPDASDDEGQYEIPLPPGQQFTKDKELHVLHRAFSVDLNRQRVKRDVMFNPIKDQNGSYQRDTDPLLEQIAKVVHGSSEKTYPGAIDDLYDELGRQIMDKSGYIPENDLKKQKWYQYGPSQSNQTAMDFAKFVMEKHPPPEQMYDLAKKWGLTNPEDYGIAPPGQTPGSYTAPGLGDMLLDYGETSGYEETNHNPDRAVHGLGNHWSQSSDTAMGFGGGNYSYNSLPVWIEGGWNGLGEDPNRTGTGNAASGLSAVSHPGETEVTLAPGAPVQVRKLRIRPYVAVPAGKPVNVSRLGTMAQYLFPDKPSSFRTQWAQDMDEVPIQTWYDEVVPWLKKNADWKNWVSNAQAGQWIEIPAKSQMRYATKTSVNDLETKIATMEMMFA